MSRDEAKFDDADEFRPERFLTEEGKLLAESTLSSNPIFGLGRRICECHAHMTVLHIRLQVGSVGPGRFAAEAFVWVAIASILSGFLITKAKDADGKEIEVKRKFTTGISM